MQTDAAKHFKSSYSIQDTPEAKKLQTIFEGLEEKALRTLRQSSDTRELTRAQAELDLIDEATTQFFRKEKKKSYDYKEPEL